MAYRRSAERRQERHAAPALCAPGHAGARHRLDAARRDRDSFPRCDPSSSRGRCGERRAHAPSTSRRVSWTRAAQIAAAAESGIPALSCMELARAADRMYGWLAASCRLAIAISGTAHNRPTRPDGDSMKTFFTAILHLVERPDARHALPHLALWQAGRPGRVRQHLLRGRHRFRRPHAALGDLQRLCRSLAHPARLAWLDASSRRCRRRRSENYVPREWQKPHQPNLTGTPAAYRPKGSILSKRTAPAGHRRLRCLDTRRLNRAIATVYCRHNCRLTAC